MLTKTKTLTGEDEVIIVALVLIAVVTLVALIALAAAPSESASIIPALSVSIAAISLLATRHPPITSKQNDIAVIPVPPSA